MEASPVLIIGGGGREHALAWACAATAGRVVVAGGNGGISGEGLETAPYTDVAGAVALAKSLKPSVVIVGPEAPLSEGLADLLVAEGIPCFGPSKGAAELEYSKAFSKDFMQRHNIPTARYGCFKDFAAAEAYIRGAGFPVVVKASGLAAGKGVIVPRDTEEAVAAARSMLVEGAFGAAGSEVVIEEQLRGVEASVLAFTDGKTVVPMPAAQDHKRAYEFDRGNNTGGMGAYAPAPIVDAALMSRIVSTVLQPTVSGLASEGRPYVGVIYAGLMIDTTTSSSKGTEKEFKVLEFNCRLGDPETEVLLPLLETPFLDVVRACVEGRLAGTPVTFKRGVVAATVIAASGGYPGDYSKGLPIAFGPRASGLKLAAGARSGSIIFHAGTAAKDGGVVTSGGRVLAVTSLGPSLKAAVSASYAVLEDVSFPGCFYRRDIGGVYVRPAASSEPLRIAVLGSTRGSSLLPLLAALEDGSLPGAKIVAVVSNKEDAGILEKGKAAGIPSIAIPSAGKSREAFESAVIQELDSRRVDLVLLIGFMRVLTPAFTERFAHRILNVHPSLLPEFAGGMDLAVHEAVIKAGKTVSGCSVHLVDREVDGGFVLVQRACAVSPGETPESLKAKVQPLEGQALVEAVKLYTDDSPVDLLQLLRKAGGSWEAIAAQLPADRLPAPGSVGGAVRLTYAAAGVDIDAGDQLVENIKPLAKSTARKGGEADLGGFGGLFDLKAAGYEDPLLVSGTDGVGTKLRVAQIAGVHNTVGIDLVAMSVNDLVVQGAEPLVFLDYFATGKLDVAEATAVIEGIAEGCRQAGCALVGGETAEMPSMYAPGDYDLAGFAVGAVERSRVLPVLDQQVDGDVLLGIASSGVHSNGFSLVRRVVSQYGVDWQAPPPFASPCKRLCDAVLTPTKIYIKCLLPTLKDASGCKIKAMAHITGGGLPDNLPRVLAPGMQATIDATSWPILPVFRWLQSVGGGVEPFEMTRTFNCGIGMVLVVDKEHAEAVKAAIAKEGEAVYTIGALRKHPGGGQPDVLLEKLAEAFSA